MNNGECNACVEAAKELGSSLTINSITLRYHSAPLIKNIVVSNELNDNELVDVYPTTEEKKGVVSEVSSALNQAYMQGIL